jgi:hypothetical protein
MTLQVAVEIIEAAPVSVEVVEKAGVQVVEIDRPTQAAVVEVIHPGPQGPPGEVANSYTHSQPVPSPTWTMPHNLGFRPSVELLNSGGQEIEGDILHLSENVCIAYFNQPIAGLARLN